FPPVFARNRQKRKPSMSVFTAFALSLNNLMTKKGRTLLTSFAGSIGIIGIALILALSTGINTYINQVQEETLSSYPITIMAESTDMSDLMVNLMGVRRENSEEIAGRDPDRVYSSTVMYDMLDSMMNAQVQTNNLKDFKVWLDQGGGGIRDLATVQYSYDFSFNIYTQDEDGNILKSDVMDMLQSAMGAMYGGDYSSYFSSMGSMYSAMDVWEELLPGDNGEAIGSQVKNQYDLLYGKWPENYDEIILFVDGNNEISDLMLYALGLISSDDMNESMKAMAKGETIEAETLSWSYEELCDTPFKLLLPAEKYRYDEATGAYTDMSTTKTGMDYLYNSSDVGTVLKVVGIARPSEESNSGMVKGAIGYTAALTEYAIDATAHTDIVKKQLSHKDTDVILALPFATGEEEEPSDEEKREAVTALIGDMTVVEKARAYMDVMGQPGDDYISAVVTQQMAGMTRESIEQMIVSQYAAEMGVDEETLTSYIAEMDDETLFGRIEEAIAAQVREQYAMGVQQQLGAMTSEQLAGALDMVLEGNEQMLAMAGMAPFAPWQYNYLYDGYMPPTLSQSTYEDNLDTLGYVDLESPSTISIYATTFSDKDKIADLIGEYNAGVESSEDEITYTDYVALLMSSITSIISGISYLLIAFVSISLVVSSIMIGIITYISVLERTKEIGILRAVGASKRDVSRVFNAETFIVGLCAGLIGIG
ncbi:MAG: FtsX-like permease family protein, partial [Oscillospiraceae bacterium]|nr:FtsX-like permease family protein [Oscillospiraceae bacterium]